MGDVNQLNQGLAALLLIHLGGHFWILDHVLYFLDFQMNVSKILVGFFFVGPYSFAAYFEYFVFGKVWWLVKNVS